MKQHYYYGFSGWLDIGREFAAKVRAEPEFVYAVYSTPPYEGHATVIFRRDGQWYEAGGGHCSCYGLEDQWSPEPLDPTVHLSAVQQGKCELLVADTEGDYPKATQAHFNEWLAWAVQQL